MTDAANPLLQEHTFPPFKAIRPQHVAPAVQALTQTNLKQLAEQLHAMQWPTWDSLVAPLEAREDKLNNVWSPVSHLNGVANDEALRQAYNQSIALLTDYNTQMGQNNELFEAYQKLARSDEYQGLNQAQKQAINNAIRDFKLAGVNLDAAAKQRFGDIQGQLSELCNQFSNNVLDATHGWFKHVLEQKQLAGLPQSAIDAARQTAKDKQLEGWVFTLDGPVYLTVMTQADDRQLRREIYTGYMTRASDQGPSAGRWDNTEVIEKILALRQELAHLLGFSDYAQLSLAPKMAESCEQVLSFLHDLAAKAKPHAEQELAELKTWVEQTFAQHELEVWDIPYYSEKLKEAKYEVSQEMLRPYFTLPNVLNGLFEVASKLFNITIRVAQNDDVWHPDATFYAIERNGEVIAHFYLDLFARPGKRGGAWMAECRVRRQRRGGLQLPCAFLVCNFNAPVDGKPCLLTHNEVTTLFHEFGHGLHHMLTTVDVAAVSGINGVAWDAVELPSQFLENWAWQPQVIKTLSSHYQTGEPLSDQLIGKMLAAKNFQSAMMTMRQLEFSLFDLQLHMLYGNRDFPGVQALLDQVRRQVAVVSPPAFNRFQHGFSHIFAGGYAAGYYSYKWAEVLSADAFAAFEETSLFDAQTGERFLTSILQRGGSEDAMTLFKDFRGREPSIEPLLRHSGITRGQ